MLRVDENMDATAEDDELLLVLCRLAGGALEALLFEEDIFTKLNLVKPENDQNLPEVRSGLRESDRKPRNGFVQMKWKKKQH